MGEIIFLLLLFFVVVVFNKFIYFIYLFLAALGLPCGAWAPHCSGFSCCTAQSLGTRVSVVMDHGL